MRGAEVFWKMGKFLLKFRGGTGIMSKSYAGVLELVDEVDSKSTTSFPVAPALTLEIQGFFTTQYVRWISCPSTMSLRFLGGDIGSWTWKYKSRCVGIGRRGGLKIHCQRWRAGSSPATGTIPATPLLSRGCGLFYVPPMSLCGLIFGPVFSYFVVILGGTLEGHVLNRSRIDTQDRIC